jgi:hypothetical protein
MMELEEGAITFLVSREQITLEVHDRTSNLNVCKIEMSAEQLASALGRLGYTPVDKLEVSTDFDKLGKTMEMERLVFPLPKGKSWHDRKKAAIENVFFHCPSGWQPDLYFGSQNSFFTGDDGSEYARTAIRRWV